ncbi:cell wall-binding repeat-containing protein [Sutcliffiella horikoshii]|nr:cell wall-binding repeat-containing protein [Sutcliffiella horikoshii]
MKKAKLLISLLTIMLVLPQSIKAEESKICTQPSFIEVDILLTTEALAQNIPPEVVKAIAFVESDGWLQCKDGQPNVSPDNGIGIMQVTDARYDEERLKYDIEYNIQAGVSILNEKFGYSGVTITMLNDGSRDVIENWYFAVMAYNGIKQVNSPLYRADGERNYNSYQDRVFKRINESSNLNLNTALEEIELSHLNYGDNGALSFEKLDYSQEGVLHNTKHKFHPKDLVVATEEVNLRNVPRKDGTSLGKLDQEVVMIEDTFGYDTSISDRRNYNHFVWYPVSSELAGLKKTGFVASSYLTSFGKRISGAERYSTANEIALEGWDKAETIVVASGQNFPDALAGAPLAFKLDAPILLTKKDSLPDQTMQMIKKLGAKKVILLGGTGAVSENVQKSIEAIQGVKVERINGATRYETAAKIAEHLGGSPEKAVIANGSNFPDALAIAPYAAKNGYPILLIKEKADTINEPTAKLLRDKEIKSTIVAGGTSAVTDAVLKALPGADRISGKDRYATSVEIIKELNLPTENIYTATGRSFADALTGSVLAAKKGTSILLVDDKERTVVSELVSSKNLHNFQVLGGRSAVNDQALNLLFKASKGIYHTSDLSEYERKVIELVNVEREKHGVNLLSTHVQLSLVAREKSLDMKANDYFNHTSPVYGTPFEMMDFFNIEYTSASENIARGHQSPEQVVSAWMNSAGHKANILDPNMTHIGVGYEKELKHWTQMFIGK